MRLRLPLACLALGALSLLLPSEPTYDPWAWVVWGRELATGHLDTTGGPSWKPLPVAFTTAFAPLGAVAHSLPPDLWLVLSRAAGLMAIVLCFRLAARLAGPPRATAWSAGALAAAALLLTPMWPRYLAHGNEAPMAIALMLAGLERHLDGKRRQALVLGFLACLLRPEAVLLLGPYGLWLWWREPGLRLLLAVLAAALPALWIVPEWIGSGDPLGAADQARSEPSWSLSLSHRPWLAALQRADRITGLPLELGALAAVGFAAYRRERLALALAAVAAVWLGVFVAMTQNGFSGNPRYLLPASVIVCVLGAVGLVRTAAAARRLSPVAVAVAAVAIAALAAPRVHWQVDRARASMRDTVELARLHRGLADAVRAAGGPEGVVPYGAPTVNRPFETHLAWELRLTLRDVEVGRGRGVRFVSTAPVALPAGRPGPRRGISRELHIGDTWSVFTPTSRLAEVLRRRRRSARLARIFRSVTPQREVR